MENKLLQVTLGLIILGNFITTATFAEEITIPDWIKNTAGWWANNQIENSDFIPSIEYLVENKILILPQLDLEVTNSEEEIEYRLPKKDETTNVEISGYLNPNLGNTIELIIIKPDSSVEEITPKIDKGLQYSHVFKINENFPIGKYEIIGRMYSGDIIQVETFNVKERYEIPLWIKNIASWWAQDKISDKDFISGIQFLIKTKVIELDHALQNNPERQKEPKIIENLDLLFPTYSDLDKIRKSADDWQVMKKIDESSITPRVGAINSSSMIFYNLPQSEYRNLGDYYDDYTGFYLIDVTTAEIFRFNNQTNSDRFWDPTFPEGLPPVGSHPLTGNCIGGNTGVSYVIECTKETFSVAVNAYPARIYEKPGELAGFFMDSILEEINHSMGIKYDISVLDVIIPIGPGKTGGQISTTREGFSDLLCERSNNDFVSMTGKFTNGPQAESSIYFTLSLEDENGVVLATGSGSVSDMGPYQTKHFQALVQWSGSYSECIIEID